MYRLTSATLLRAATLALIIPVVACGKKDEAYTEPSASTTTIPPAAPVAAALVVEEIDVGKGLNPDRTLKDKTDDFAVRDTIYASVKTEGASAGSRLAAKWTFQSGQTVSESSQNISPTGGETRHEFHLAKASAWPKGDYKVEILLDGVSAGTKDFSIK
ncbi:MAG TPA: hypothetical protein VES88_01295 [Gemmatimonadaceae bacterium]|nr:hypothetical protein [Gemmatimonadaceae bacterium]